MNSMETNALFDVVKEMRGILSMRFEFGRFCSPIWRRYVWMTKQSAPARFRCLCLCQTKGFRYLFHIVILAVCVSITSANATLIIGAFNNETLFVASDSCMTFQAGERLQQFKVPKLFKVSDRCCVSICNRYGGYIRIPQTTNVVQFLLPKELSKICSQYSASETNLEVGIDQVNSHFAIVYHYYVANRLDADPNPETRLTYWGYDQTHPSDDN